MIARESWAASCALALAAGAPAQRSAVVVPAQFANSEARGIEFWALAPYARRCQLVLGTGLMAPLTGASVRSIIARRNGDGDSLAPGRLQVQLWMSHAASTPASASPSFAANRGPDHRSVFRGWIDLPGCPPPSRTPASWSPPQAVAFALDAPFLFGSGALCIEAETNPDPSQPVWWPLDAVVDPVPGQSIAFGSNCVPAATANPAAIDANSLALAGTALCSLTTNLPGNPLVLCLLGNDDRMLGGVRLPFALAALGAPGCALLTNSIVSLPVPLQSVGSGSAAVLPVWLPGQTALAGVSFFSQWVVGEPSLNALGLVTSNGVRATLAPTGARWDAAWIDSVDPSAPTGWVLTGRLPVLRFEQ